MPVEQTAGLGSSLLLVDLCDPVVIDFSRAERGVRSLVDRDIRPWIEGGATDAQIQREVVRAYRRHFYTPDMIATWSFRQALLPQLLEHQQQGYQIVFFGEHLQLAYASIDQWCQQQCPGLAYHLALNDLPFFVEEQQVLLSGMGQTIYEQTPWAFCLMWTLVRLYGATSVLMVTGRTGMERYVEQANMQPPVGIQVVQRLDAFQEGGHP